MTNKPLCVGIDLGTSNSAMCIADSASSLAPEVQGVTQVFSPGTIGEQAGLPSALFIAKEHEFPEGSFKLPWSGSEEQASDGSRFVVGSFARDHGALVPDRAVTSAKSWLCNQHVDRRAAILPWGSELETHKLSPVVASEHYLRHLRENLLFLNGSEQLRSLGQHALRTVLTVPASFDEVARSLTQEAAERSGWGTLTLLEEPQAAFYAWIASQGDAWREQVSAGDVVLVCDLGGGTADFSAIAVSDQDGLLELTRVSVGEHILLGGDNMDLALAYTLRAEAEEKGEDLDEWQFRSLIHLVRSAKERLFSEENLQEIPLSIAKRGSSLFAGTLSLTLRKDHLEAVVLDGFFPKTEVTELPIKGSDTALRDFGLSYASDPAVSRHLAKFLRDSATNIRSDSSLQALFSGSTEAPYQDAFLKPTCVLFNGGVFQSEALRSRVTEILHSWTGSEIRALTGTDLSLAVARGAAYYARMIESGEGIRIRAGTARSYYVGLETSMPAVPGFRPKIKGLCVLPQGTEEGSVLEPSSEEFGLVTGETVSFRFYSSKVRAGDSCGTIVADAERELDAAGSLELSLPLLDNQGPAEDSPGRSSREVLPVRLQASVTELGNLELWLEHTRSSERWKLDFNLRAVD